MLIRALFLSILALTSLHCWHSSAETDPKSLMVSPGDNSFFEIRDRSRDLKIVFRRPDPKLLYKLEVILNGRKLVNHFTNKDTFRVHLGKHDHELKWRVQAYDQEENLVLANDFSTLKVHQNERLRKIDLTLDRYSLKNKLIIT